MKKLLFILIFIGFTSTSFSQAFQKGGNYIQFGFGVTPWGYVPSTALWGSSYYSVGPIVAAYELGITDVIGIGRIGGGVIMGHSFQGQKYSDGDYVKWSRTSVVLRAAYHFDFNIDKMDVYAGVGGGANIYSKERTNIAFYTEDNGYVRPIHYVFAGIRYYFTPNLGVYAEVGDGVATIHGGLVFGF